ncbi:MAG: orotidine-5'-phosphate decarboxylase, partial [Alphaproteobacteria bacterium]
MSAPKDAPRNIFVALDTADLPAALALARRLTGHVAGVKLGLEFFAAHGPEGVRSIADSGQPIFLDLKLHDIPNTVAGAVKAILALEPAMITTHAGGGPAMLRAAVEGARARASAAKRPLVLAVTVLTSLDDDDLGLVGQARPAVEQVARLARLAEDSGLDGVVCAPG